MWIALIHLKKKLVSFILLLCRYLLKSCNEILLLVVVVNVSRSVFVLNSGNKLYSFRSKFYSDLVVP